jgi:hypothetical protein
MILLCKNYHTFIGVLELDFAYKIGLILQFTFAYFIEGAQNLPIGYRHYSHCLPVRLVNHEITSL